MSHAFKAFLKLRSSTDVVTFYFPAYTHPKLNLGNKLVGGRRNIYLHMLNIMDLLKTALVCTSAIAHQVEGGGRVRVKHEETVSGESSEEEKEHF